MAFQDINRLLVEGKDDEYVINDLLNRHNINNLFHIKSADGINNLVKSLKDEIIATDLHSLGVILDVDQSFNSAWNRIKNILIELKCTDIPMDPNPEGTIVKNAKNRKIGVWLMPDNQNTGMLEDFISLMIPKNDDLWPKAKIDVENIPQCSRRFKPDYLSKAQVHTWLAWQEEPGTRMGQSFKKQYLDSNCELAVSFVNWAKGLLD